MADRRYGPENGRVAISLADYHQLKDELEGPSWTSTHEASGWRLPKVVSFPQGAETPWWPVQNESDHDAIGIIASRTVRTHGQLESLIRDNIATFENYFIFVTWGTYVDLILDTVARGQADALTRSPDPWLAYKAKGVPWHSRWNELRTGYVLRPGKHGGIIEMAERLERSAPARDQIKALIFLTHPSDFEESLPQDWQLIRRAIHNNVIYLPTLRSAQLWTAFEASSSRARRKGSATIQPTRSEEDVLAMIADEGMTRSLCLWLASHQNRIRRFRSIVAAGATGESLRKFLLALDVPNERIHISGGGVEVAGDVLRGAIDHLVCFADPEDSQDPDIRSLLTVCGSPEVTVNARFTEMGATSWIRSI